jgi:hypothetical protein
MKKTISLTSKVVASGTTGSCTWTLTGTSGNYTLTISGSGAMEDYDTGVQSWHSYRDGIKTLDLKPGVTVIGENAFCGCRGLISVTIPDSVTDIGNCAFQLCSYLTSITIPNSVTVIGKMVFDCCFGLTSLTIPNSVTDIGMGAFHGCYRLTSIIVDTDNPNYSSINGVLFSKLQDILIRYPIGKTGDYTIPDSVTDIGMGAFYNCRSLTSVIIPDSVTAIGEGAFLQCNGLTSVSIGNSVTNIGAFAFSDCDKLTELYVKAQTPPALEDDVFENVPDTLTIHLPRGTADTYRKASGWSGFSNYIEDIAWIALKIL